MKLCIMLAIVVGLVGVLPSLVEGSKCTCTEVHPQTSLCNADFGKYFIQQIIPHRWRSGEHARPDCDRWYVRTRVGSCKRLLN